jgi:ABC-type Zn uptake system ZnuABC Zn-binding protein ZnuA
VNTRTDLFAAGLLVLSILSAVPAGAADSLRVVATTPDLAEIARTVGGDRVDVSSIARPTEDPHFVDPRPSFVRTLNEADVLIEGGAQLEAGWLPTLVDGARNPKIAPGGASRIVASQGIALRDVPTRLDRSMGDVHPLGNPHYLLDPVNAKTVAATIAAGLCAADAAGCAGHRDGAARFAAAIDAKLPEWQDRLAAVKGAKVVTYHKNFDYFADRFGLVVVDNLEPKPGIPPSPAHVAALVPRMQAEGVKLLLVEPNREQQTPEFVAEKTGARIVALPLMPGAEGTSDYVGLIDFDVKQLADAAKEAGLPAAAR